MPRLPGLALALAGFVACGRSAPEPTAIRLIDRFDTTTVVGTVSAEVPEPTVWWFDGEGSVPTPEDDTEGAERINRERVLRGIGDAVEPPLYAALIPGDDIQTYTLENVARSFPIASIRNILVQPTDTAGAEFAIESIRLIPRGEHLLSLDSGPGWHGLSEIYRETIISRSPEQITIDVDAQTNPWLDLAVGTIEDGRSRSSSG